MALSTAAVPYSQITNISRVQCFRPFPVRSPRISTLAMPFTHNIIINTNIGCSSWELLISGSKLPEIKVRPKSVLLVPKAAVGTEDFIVEPDTNVKFLTSLKAPGGSNLLSLAGIAFREKKIAFIGVKVYAIGFYVDAAIRSSLAAWNGKLGSQIEQDSIFFKAVSEAPVEKSLQIVLVRDIDGETFWSALDEALSPRLKFMGAAEQKALAIFQETFKGRPLKQGTIINLTWLQPSIMLIKVQDLELIDHWGSSLCTTSQVPPEPSSPWCRDRNRSRNWGSQRPRSAQSRPPNAVNSLRPPQSGGKAGEDRNLFPLLSLPYRCACLLRMIVGAMEVVGGKEVA